MAARNNTIDTLGSLTVSGITLAKVLNVTDRRIRQYAEEGIVKKPLEGNTNCFKAYKCT